MSKKKMLDIFKLQRLIILILFSALVLSILIMSLINSSRSNRIEEQYVEIERLNLTIAELQYVEEVRIPPWNLQLINEANPLPDDHVPDLVEIAPYFFVDSRISENARNMLATAESEGILLNIVSAYVSFEHQRDFFSGRMLDLNIQGYNMFDAYRIAAASVFIPGTNEQQAGFSIVFGPGPPAYYGQVIDFAQTPEATWLLANAHRFGFVQRFPEAKADVTGVDFAPWMFRFVGLDEATDMNQRGLTLEEYLQAEFD